MPTAATSAALRGLGSVGNPIVASINAMIKEDLKSGDHADVELDRCSVLLSSVARLTR